MQGWPSLPDAGRHVGESAVGKAMRSTAREPQ